MPWNEHILKQTLEAYEGLVEAINNRLPPSSTLSPDAVDNNQRATIATEDTLPSEIKGFPRVIPPAASKPRFRYIAPGLTVNDPANPSARYQFLPGLGWKHDTQSSWRQRRLSAHSSEALGIAWRLSILYRPWKEAG
ncbi:hypothetical protein BJX61DRAFT_543266 [Aspergillus egyptiacus]|nr:hypothetical protein BJX61DRAFT_543266 [Aspergillus egyptiacus]